MPFVTRCLVCHVKVKFPDTKLGASVACPRCGNFFTAAPEDGPRAAAPSTFHQPLPERATAPANQDTAAAAATGSHETAAAAAHLQSVASPSAKKPWLNPWGAVAFFFTGIGLFSASQSFLTRLTIPLLIAGLVLGLVVWLLEGQRKRAILSAAAASICLPALVVAWLWPSLLGPAWASSRAGPLLDPGRQFLVPRERKPEKPVETPARASVDFAKQGIRQGTVEVFLHHVVISPMHLAGPVDEKLAKEKFLQVFVRIRHLGAGDVIKYESWARGNVQLKDDQRQTYPQAQFPAGVEVQGRFPWAFVVPGRDPVSDVLVFRPPDKNPAYFELALPGSALGMNGSFQFKLPAGAIATLEKAPAPILNKGPKR